MKGRSDGKGMGRGVEVISRDARKERRKRKVPGKNYGKVVI